MDDLIKKAIISAANIEARYFESLPDSEHTLSDGADERIRKRITEERKPAKIPMKKLVALLIAAALLMALTVTAVAYREQIGNLFESIFDGHNDYVGNDDSQKFKLMEISYIPSGFNEQLHQRFIDHERYIWTKDELSIEIYYLSISNGVTHIDTQNAIQSTMLVNDTVIRIFTKNNTRALLWDDGTNKYLLTCSEAIDLAEIEKIIWSIEPIGEGD